MTDDDIIIRARELEEIEAAYTAASGEWDGADWTHDAGQRDPHDGYATDPDSDEYEYCEGGHAATCPTCAAAEADAAEAERLADLALEDARAGRWADALEAAREAARLERRWGDDPVWRPFRLAIEAAADAAAAAASDEYAEDEEVES